MLALPAPIFLLLIFRAHAIVLVQKYSTAVNGGVLGYTHGTHGTDGLRLLSANDLGTQSKPTHRKHVQSNARDANQTKRKNGLRRHNLESHSNRIAEQTEFPNYGVRARACAGIPGFKFDHITAGARVADFASRYYHSNLGVFLGGCLGAAFGIACACMEDIVWLLPFVLSSDCEINGMIYVGSMGFIWVLSICVLFCVRWFAAEDSDLPIKEIIEVGTAGFMLLLTISFFCEWYREQGMPDALVDQPLEGSQVKHGSRDDMSKANARIDGEGMLKDKVEHERERTSTHRGERLRSFAKLLSVCFATNLDNIGIFVLLMLRGVFSPVELFVGNIIARMIIIRITLLLSTVPGLSVAIKKVPLWLMLALLTLYACSSAVVTIINGM